MLNIEVLNVAILNITQELGDRTIFVLFKDKVEVIGHETVGNNSDLMRDSGNILQQIYLFVARFLEKLGVFNGGLSRTVEGESLDKSLIVSLGIVGRLTIDPTIKDVIVGTSNQGNLT